MLNATDLANAITGSMGKAGNATDAHNNFTNAIKDYVLANIELKGVYTGIIPQPAPDPLNGPYTWKAVSFDISATNLQQGARNGFSGWENAISVECDKITFEGADENSKITTSSPTKLTTSITIDMSGKPDKMDNAMIQVATGIVNGLLAAIPTPSSTSAKSTDNGTGTVAWGTIS